MTRKIYQSVAAETQELKDDLESYLSLGPELVADGDIAVYWRVKTLTWPRLSRMARDYLAIPATSASSERSFSVGRHLLGLYRHRLRSQTMEACVCLRSWFRAGLLTNEDISRELVDRVEEMVENGGLIEDDDDLLDV